MYGLKKTSWADSAISAMFYTDFFGWFMLVFFQVIRIENFCFTVVSEEDLVSITGKVPLLANFFVGQQRLLAEKIFRILVTMGLWNDNFWFCKLWNGRENRLLGSYRACPVVFSHQKKIWKKVLKSTFFGTFRPKPLNRFFWRTEWDITTSDMSIDRAYQDLQMVQFL